MITGLDHVQVAAPPGCEAAARAFYGELLRLAEVAKPAPMRASGGVWFSLGAQQLQARTPLAGRFSSGPGLSTCSSNPARLRSWRSLSSFVARLLVSAAGRF